VNARIIELVAAAWTR